MAKKKTNFTKIHNKEYKLPHDKYPMSREALRNITKMKWGEWKEFCKELTKKD